MTSLHVVLVHPEIHWNTGNAGRTCLAAGATLHLIEPLGFSLDEREVKRAGLDYWEHVDVRVWPSWQAFERELPAVLRAALKLASHRLRHVAAVEQHLDELAPVRVDAVRLSQVFVNLLVNAGQALEEGAPANLVLYDPAATRVVDPAETASLSRNTPYGGRELPGRVVATFLRGRATVLDGKLA